MDDRTLLELAARAAGIELGPWSECMSVFDMPISSTLGIPIWNALTSDRDAFRLAAALRMDVQNSIGDTCRVEIWNPVAGEYIPAEESHGDDAAAATRRAIVRAAAAIAQEMTDAQG